MDELVTVEAAKPHDNAYGNKPDKAEGDQYLCPRAIALQLKASELVRILADAAPADEPPVEV